MSESGGSRQALWQGWDRVSDVVVVGTGIAGSSAALSAARSGSSVTILEKASFVGGTTARSGGGMWIPNNSALRSRGLVDDRVTCLRYMARSAYPTLYLSDHPTLGLPSNSFELLEAYFDRAHEVVDELVNDQILDLEEFEFSDYYSDLPEAVAWSHQLVPRLPEHWQRGDPSGGQQLVSQLTGAALKHGAMLSMEHRVVDLVTNPRDEIVGAEVHVGRRTLLIGARKGIVFGSGGFLHNKQMTSDYLRGSIFGGAGAASSTGDFVEIGARVGAQLGNMSNAWWDQVVVEQALENPRTSRDVFNAYGDSMIMVNRFGKRVLNEKAPYTDRGQVHFYWSSLHHEYPNRLLFMIFDDAVRTSTHKDVFDVRSTKLARFPVPFPNEQPEYLISAPTIEALNAAVRARLGLLEPSLGEIDLAPDFTATLNETIARFNMFAGAGVDADFGRGESLVEKSWSLPPRIGAASSTMFPFAETGPYHCVILGAGAFETKGGPRVNRLGQVLRATGMPIPGLFAAGNCAASPAGQAYWGPGTTIGLGLVFGYLAGQSAAREPLRGPQDVTL